MENLIVGGSTVFRWVNPTRLRLLLIVAFWVVAFVAGSGRQTSVVQAAQAQAAADDDKSITVYITKTGTKYHKAECRYLAKSSIPITLDVAAKRFTACSVCRPPLPSSSKDKSKE
jgi:hypothetical protein